MVAGSWRGRLRSGSLGLRGAAVLTLCASLASWTGCSPAIKRFGVSVDAVSTKPVNEVHYTCPTSDGGAATVGIDWQASGRTRLEMRHLDPDTGSYGPAIGRPVPHQGTAKEQISASTQFALLAEHNFLYRLGPPAVERQDVVLVGTDGVSMTIGEASRCEAGHLVATIDLGRSRFQRNVAVSELRSDEAMDEAFADPNARLLVRHGAESFVLAKDTPSVMARQVTSPGGEWLIDYAPAAARSCEELQRTDLLRTLSLEAVLRCAAAREKE